MIGFTQRHFVTCVQYVCVCVLCEPQISNSALISAYKAVTQLEKTCCRGESRLYLKLFDTAPRATRHHPDMQLVPLGGNDPDASGDPLKPTLTFEMIRRCTLSDPVKDTSDSPQSPDMM